MAGVGGCGKPSWFEGVSEGATEGATEGVAEAATELAGDFGVVGGRERALGDRSMSVSVTWVLMTIGEGGTCCWVAAAGVCRTSPARKLP